MLVKEKVAQAVALLTELGIDCWITFVRESALNGDPTLPYLVSGSLTWHSALIITRSGRTCAIVGEYDRRSVEDLGAYGEVIGYVKGIREDLQRVLRSIDPQQIAVNYSVESEICDGLTHGMYLTLMDLLTGIGMQGRVVQADPIISALRQRKTATELEAIRGAIGATETIFADVAGFIAPGRTERAIAAYMQEQASKMGLTFAWDENTCPAVFTGPDTAAAHYAPTDRPAEPGQILNMDFGLRYHDYCSDLQRTFYLLEKGETRAPAEVQKGFSTIVRSIEACRKAMRPGVQGIEIDTLSRRMLADGGYGEYPHALGHQVGRFAHDGTALLGPAWEKYAGKPFFPLEEGMVFTLEPRLTVPGRGVATIEEMVVVTPTGAEFLSRPQTELMLVHP